VARSNKPLVWSLFAAGGTLAAFVLPVLVVLTLLAGYGRIADGLDYANVHALASSWIGKAVLLALISLLLWHAAHRMRDALHGLGLRADKAVAVVAYGTAAAGTLLSLVFLLRI
jgi:fumarate reductase subunit D